jgi:hypothetical protein
MSQEVEVGNRSVDDVRMFITQLTEVVVDAERSGMIGEAKFLRVPHQFPVRRSFQSTDGTSLGIPKLPNVYDFRGVSGERH